jgi:hypothetical protein
MRRARALQCRRRLRRRAERCGERALIGKREAKHLRFGDGALCCLAGGGHHEVADAAAFDLGGALDDGERFRRQPRLKPGRTGAVAVHREILSRRNCAQNAVQSTGIRVLLKDDQPAQLSDTRSGCATTIAPAANVMPPCSEFAARPFCTTLFRRQFAA